MAQNLALCYSLCRVFCYSLYKMTCCVQQAEQKPEFDILCLGLSGSGKSAILNSHLEQLSESDLLERTPTPGFSIRDVITDNATLHVKEIGGAEQIRPYWHRYFGEHVDAVLFAVDASDTSEETVRLAGTELRNLLKHEALLEADVFIVATHTDCEGAVTADELPSMLNVTVGQQDNRAGGIHLFSCSCRNRQSVLEVFNKMADILCQDEEEGGEEVNEK